MYCTYLVDKLQVVTGLLRRPDQVEINHIQIVKIYLVIIDTNKSFCF